MMFLNLLSANIRHITQVPRRTAVAQWLKRYATNRKVAGSIPDDVIVIFH